MSYTTNAGHLAKNFSSNVYGAFAQDLVRHTQGGFNDEQCNANQLWLQEMAAAAAALPDGRVFGKKIYQRCDAVFNEYHKWNSPGGTPEIREKYLQRIKNKINKLSGTYRTTTAILEKEADINIYLAFYEATEKLTRTIPDTLGSLAKVLSSFSRNPVKD